MDARRAVIVAIAAGAAAVGIVAADTAFGLQIRIDAQDGDSWSTVWVDASRQRDPYAYTEPMRGGDCFARHFRVVADNDKPIPDRLHVKVTYWDNATKRTATITEETLSLGAFESKTLEFTVPASAGSGPYYGDPKEIPYSPAYATVTFDGGWPNGGTEATVCVARGGSS